MGNWRYYGNLVRRSWVLLARNRVLWLLGFLDATGLKLSLTLSDVATPPANPARADADALLVCGSAALSLIVILLSFVFALGLISATDQLNRAGPPPALRAAVRVGWARLSHLLLFIIPTVLLAIPFALLPPLIPAGLRSAVSPLLLLLPNAFLTLGMCTIVLDTQVAPPAVRVAWRLVWEAPGSVLLVALLAAVLNVLSTLLTSLVTLGFAAQGLPTTLRAEPAT